MELAARKSGVSALSLKWIAIVTMFVDHMGVVCYKWLGWTEAYLRMRYIGRIAFPIFVFLLIEGFRHTRDRWAYLRNLLIFSMLSEIPFDLALTGWDSRNDTQNIFWTLSLGLLVLMSLDALWIRLERGPFSRFLRLPLSLLPIAAGLGAAEALETDYHFWGVLLVVLMFAGEGAARRYSVGQRARNVGAVVGAVLWMALYDWRHGWTIELYGALSAVPILLYNGERGRYRLPKWFFYGFYPAHLLLLYALQDTLFKWLLT